MKEWKKIEGLISVYNNRAKIITWNRTKSAHKDETVLLLLHFNRHYAVREWVEEICKMVFERVALIASNGAKQKQKNKNKLRISLTRTIKMVSVWYCKVAQTLNSKLIFFLHLICFSFHIFSIILHGSFLSLFSRYSWCVSGGLGLLGPFVLNLTAFCFNNKSTERGCEYTSHLGENQHNFSFASSKDNATTPTTTSS